MTKYKVWIAGSEEEPSEVEAGDGICPAMTVLSASGITQPGMAFLMCFTPCDKPSQTQARFITIDANGDFASEEATDDHWKFWEETVIPAVKAAQEKQAHGG